MLLALVPAISAIAASVFSTSAGDGEFSIECNSNASHRSLYTARSARAFADSPIIRLDGSLHHMGDFSPRVESLPNFSDCLLIDRCEGSVFTREDEFEFRRGGVFRQGEMDGKGH
jgi:hypothetical protein